MITARGKSALVLMVVLALFALMAVPGFALADETEAPVDLAPAEDVAAVEVTAPADHAAPASEGAPAEEAAVEEAPPVVEEVAAPQASTALASRPSTTIASRVGQRFAAQDRARTAKGGLPATSKARTSKVTKLAVPDGGCSGTVGNFGLSAPVVTHDGTTSTTFTWTVTYNANDGCENEALSHITLTPCLAAIDGNYTNANDPSAGSYKWDREGLVEVGDTLTLVFAGTVSSGGSVGTSLVKANDEHTPAVTGPDCDPATCESWSVDVQITNTGIGSGTVSDNHGNGPVTDDATWTYNANQMGNVDITATGTDGSTPSNSGAADVAFSAHPDCDATYTVTFHKDGPQCESWSLDVQVTNTGIGSGTVSDNHGNGPVTDDATWTYNANQMGNVDITATGTDGSTPSNSGAADVAFSAHPDCDATYTVTFHKDTERVPDCNGDFDLTNNGPNGDCTIPLVPDCSGDFDPTNNGPNGDCIEPPPPPVDLCPNIEGDQAEVPEGMEVDEAGDCVEPAVLPVDVCPNVEGDQAEVPEGMTLNPVTGDCDEDQVLGEIIDRDPKPSKPEPEEPPAVAPSNVQAGVLPFTGGDLLPFLVVSLMLIALGATLTLRRRAEAKL